MQHLFSDFSNASPKQYPGDNLCYPRKGGKMYISLKYSYYADMQLASKHCEVLAEDL